MRVIININSRGKKYPTVSDVFVAGITKQLAARHPEHFYYLLTPANFENVSDLLPNLVAVPVNTRFFERFEPVWWYRYRLFKEVKKLRADTVASVDDINAVSDRFPCCLLLLNYNIPVPGAGRKNSTPAALRRLVNACSRASLIVAGSEYGRQLLQQAHIPSRKIALWNLAPESEPKALSWQEKEAVQQEFAAGFAYFIFYGDIDESRNLLDLLKAFSQFKKWQQSGMQLLIAGQASGWAPVLAGKLSTFKYRNDVHLLPGLSPATLNRLVAGAYAMVYPLSQDYFPLGILQAMQAGVPVITCENPVTRELAGDAVIYSEPAAESLSKHMRQLYVDERFRSNIVERAHKQLELKKHIRMAEALGIFLHQLTK